MVYFAPASRGWSVGRTATKASTAYTAGGFVTNDGTNDVMAGTTTQQYLAGILIESKASGDATTDKLSFFEPNDVNATFYGTLTTGAIAADDEGQSFDFDANGTGLTSTQTYKPVKLVKFLTTTTGIFKLNYTTGIEN